MVLQPQASALIFPCVTKVDVERKLIVFLSFYVCFWRSDPATVNITDEMSKGSFGNVWKSVNPAESTKKEPNAKRLAYTHPIALMCLKMNCLSLKGYM